LADLGDSRGLRPAGAGLVGEGTAEVAASVVKRDDGGEQHEALLNREVKFESLGLSKALVKGVAHMGFSYPSKIQAAALPYIVTNSEREPYHLLGQAQNGSGKTATFSLGLLSAINVDDMTPQVLVLNPTRELAVQNDTVIKELGRFLPVKTCLVIAQANIPRNPAAHVLIGTPGKVKDLVGRRVINLSTVKVFVLDEADEMLDDGNSMAPQVKDIQKQLSGTIQVLFLSATWTQQIRQFGMSLIPHGTNKQILNIEVKKEKLTVSAVRQVYATITGDEYAKFQKLQELYASMVVGQSIVFVNTRKNAFNLSRWMRDAGHQVSLICGLQPHGYEEQMDPAVRDRVMSEFRSGSTKVLIATDLLCRGIDVPQVTLVVNYELPQAKSRVNMETYLHRVGRTGRFGLRGVAVNLVFESELPLVQQICEHFQCRIDEHSDFDLLHEEIERLR
jgi:ATP-dependent RNA helicase DDX19/DBP5